MRAAALCAMLLIGACRTTAAPTPTAAQDPVEPVCRCADGCEEACRVDPNLKTSYRKVGRGPSAAARPTETADAFAVIDVSAGDALGDDEIEALASDLNLSVSDLLAVFRGDFVRGRGTEHAVLTTSGELRIYKDAEMFASLTVGAPASQIPMEVVKLIDDRLEVVLRHREQDRDVLTVCRVIGRAVGRVFETETDGHTVEFVHLGAERAIRVSGPDVPSTVYRWNHWEGMFRVPAPAPTAPPADVGAPAAGR